MNSYKLGLLFAATTATCWAVLALALKWTLHFASSGTIVWFRMAVAFLLLFAFYAYKDTSKLKILYKPKPMALAAGLFLSVNYFGYMKGIELTSAANSQIMIQMAPLSLALIGIFYFKESLSRKQLLGFFVASTGFVFFYWDQLILSVQNSANYGFGNLWIILAAATWAIFATLQKILTKTTYSPQHLNMLIYGVSTVLLFPLVTQSELLNFNLVHWAMVTGLGVNTLIAYGCLGEALKRIPASHVSLIICLNPLLTIFLLKLLQHFELPWISYEDIQWRGYLGASLVVTGVALTVIKKKAKKA